MSFQTYLTKIIKSVQSALPKKQPAKRSKQTTILSPSFTNAFLCSAHLNS